MATDVLPRRRPLTERLPQPRALPALAGGLGLAGTVGCGVAIALGALAGPSFVTGGPTAFHAWPAGFLGHLGGSPLDVASWGALTTAMFGFYLLAVAGAASIPARAAIAAIAALHVAFLVVPPIASKDVFNYIHYARLGTLHGLNPYTHAPHAVPGDAAFRFVGWPDLKSPYGPLYTVVSYVLAPLGVGGALWAAKAMAAAAAGASLALVWRCARLLGRAPVPALVLVGLNPAWLVWGVGGAHNDFLMVALELGALLLWLRRREGSAAGVGVLAAGIKVPALALAAILVAASRDRRRALAGAALGALGLVVLSLAVFGGLEPLTAFHAQSGYWTERSILGQLGRLTGHPPLAPHLATPAVVLLGVALAALVAWVWRAREVSPAAAAVTTAAAWASAAFVLALVWEFPWYVAWLLPFAALASGSRTRVVAVAFTGVLIAGYVPPYSYLI